MNDIQDQMFAKAKFWGKLLITDAVTLLVIFQVATAVEKQTYGPLSRVALVFILVMGIFWILPSRRNFKLKNYARLYLVLTNNRKTYHPIERIDFTGDKKESIEMVMGNQEELDQEDHEIESLEELIDD